MLTISGSFSSDLVLIADFSVIFLFYHNFSAIPILIQPIIRVSLYITDSNGLQNYGYSKCYKYLNTGWLPKKAETNSVDSDQTASEEAV